MRNDSEKKIRCEITGKICYTKREANETLKGAKNHNNRSKKIPVRKYFCEECRCYHLTHYPFYESNKMQREFKQKIKEIIAFEEKKAWREEYSLLLSA